jgi:hypothetical protein
MSSRRDAMKPDWTLIANGTRARLLQQESGAPMVILESFIHPVRPADGFAPGPSLFGELDAQWSSEHQHTEFARELAHLLEQEAQLDHYRGLTVFASAPFLGELGEEIGEATRRRLVAAHEADLTRCTLSEIEERIASELAAHH